MQGLIRTKIFIVTTWEKKKPNLEMCILKLFFFFFNKKTLSALQLYRLLYCAH